MDERVGPIVEKGELEVVAHERQFRPYEMDACVVAAFPDSQCIVQLLVHSPCVSVPSDGTAFTTVTTAGTCP